MKEETKMEILRALAFDGVGKAREIIEQEEREEYEMEEKIRGMIENIEKEYEAFRDDMQNNHSIEEVFNSAYKICTYNDLFMYFQNEDMLEIGEFIQSVFHGKDINKFITKNHILASLYDFLMDCEYGYTETWEDIQDLIRNYIVYRILDEK